MRSVASAVAIASALIVAEAADAKGTQVPPVDPFAWLEQVDGVRAMNWVMAENAKTAAVLESDPRYAGLFKDALAIAQAKDRIPEPHFIGGQILNSWQDADHEHGIWRRTSLDDYQKPQPRWTTVLDLDALSRTQKANWFWGGADCEEPGNAAA